MTMPHPDETDPTGPDEAVIEETVWPRCGCYEVHIEYVITCDYQMVVECRQCGASWIWGEP